MTESPTLPQKLLKIQRDIGALVKDAANPFFKSKYADLNQALSLAKEYLNPQGLFIAQSPGIDTNGFRFVETSIINADDGQTISCKVPIVNAEDMQKLGASITYARRFGLVSILAMESEDDDGETAVGRGATKTTKPVTQAALPAVKVAPVAPKVPDGPTRKTINEKIALTSKVIIDSKRDSLDNLLKLVAAYGVTDKEKLTDVQARELLTKLEEKIK